jgi:hypothetical protein
MSNLFIYLSFYQLLFYIYKLNLKFKNINFINKKSLISIKIKINKINVDNNKKIDSINCKFK